jgi:hypothetical protein
MGYNLAGRPTLTFCPVRRAPSVRCIQNMVQDFDLLQKPEENRRQKDSWRKIEGDLLSRPLNICFICD